MERVNISNRTDVRVRYADTDQMRVVYHAKFLEYFELGRSALIRSLGLPYSELEARGVLLPVIEAHAVYLRPAFYDDLLTIEATIKEIPKASMKIEYRVFKDSASAAIAEGYTVHSFLNASTRRPTRAPSYFIEVLEKRIK
jgi:acyl-CoA thioester hydrolase